MSENIRKNDFRTIINPDSLNLNLILALLLSALIFISYYVISQQRQSAEEGIKLALIDTNEELQVTLHHLQENLHQAWKHATLYYTFGREIDRFKTFDAIRLMDIDFYHIRALGDDRWQSSIEIPAIGMLIKNCETAVISVVSKDGVLPEFIVDPVSSDTIQFQSAVSADDIDADGTALVSEDLDEVVDKTDEALIKLGEAFHDEYIRALNNTSEGRSLMVFLIHFMLLIAVLAILVYRIRKQISKSVNQSGIVLKRIATGDIGIRMEGLSSDFREVEERSNQLIGYLHDAVEFARKIGAGDFDYDFKPQSGEDALGNALVDMRERLTEVAKADQIRNWTNEGQAKFADILRQYDDDLSQLGDQLISNLVEYMGASQGTVFILNEEESDEPFLEMLSTYAFNRKKFREKQIGLGEGLIGQTFVEKKRVYMTDIRSDHFDIQSGLGESRPSSLLIIPLKEEENVEGVIEIASFNEMKDFEIAFVERIAQSMASSIRSSKVNRTTKRLLEETQEKAEAMKAQEEELRQNMEELAATQEQMQRKNLEMEEIQDSLSREKYLLEALLNNTQDSIYFKDKDSRFIRLSQSLVKRFGATSADEVIGKNDFDFQDEEHARQAFEDEQRIIKTGIHLVDVVEKEKWTDGRVTWVSTSKNPLTDHHGNIIGTFGISRDVTEAKLSELEVKKQADWMFNYFKNSEDELYVVLDQDGKVNFASPDILELLGMEEYHDQTYSDLFVEPSFEVLLSTIQFESMTTAMQEVSLQMNNKEKTRRKFKNFAASQENEDGSRNIFMIGI